MAAVAELDASLQALLTLKPPGVTKGRIQSITQLAVENFKSESVIIQKIFAHFKRTPATHKLGVLYAVDSVARQWIEKAAASGQGLKAGDSTDGTYAAGVNRISELLPTMMGDLVAQAPNDQLDKINKLVDIWERGNTFPAPMVAEFKQKIVTRTTAQRSPEPEKPAEAGNPAPAESNGIVALHAVQPPTIPENSTQSNFQEQATAPTPATTAPTSNALSSVLPPSALSDPQKTAHYLQVLQQLVTMGIPSEQWSQVINALEDQQKTSTQPVPQQTATTAPAQQPPQQQQADSTQSPPRGRSRSPVRRGSPTYGSYRERSPLRQNRTKWVEYDSSLPPNHIKVLSRTLFVGGTTCSEPDLRDVFSTFGVVQSVICQQQKRHAFVKMYTREESVRAKTEMDRTDDQGLLSRARSTKWGVGFGPRECCNYDQGVSIIPIDRLTDADRRWILTAECGGNGGIEITGGQVIEEPDIEIGAGVSSKAISLKVNQGPQQQNRRPMHQNRRHNNNNNNNNSRGPPDHRDRNQGPLQHRGPPPPNYNPNPFPPYQPEQPMMPPPMQEPPPMAMGFPPPMPFNFPPQGGYNFPPPGMPPFPMQ